MKPVLLSIIVSVLLAFLVGISLQYCFHQSTTHVHSGRLIFGPVIVSAIANSILLNLCFFFIRRWDGCIEKLGGATFTGFFLLAIAIGLISVASEFPTAQVKVVSQYLAIVSIQLFFIGWIATHFLRTSRYTPPKPGECWRW